MRGKVKWSAIQKWRCLEERDFIFQEKCSHCQLIEFSIIQEMVVNGIHLVRPLPQKKHKKFKSFKYELYIKSVLRIVIAFMIAVCKKQFHKKFKSFKYELYIK